MTSVQIRQNVSQNPSPQMFTSVLCLCHVADQIQLDDPFVLISCTSTRAAAVFARWHPCRCQMFVLTIAQIHHVICSGSSRPILSDLSKIDSLQIPASPLPVRSQDPLRLTSGKLRY